MRQATILLGLLTFCGCAATGRSRAQTTVATGEQIGAEVDAAQSRLMKTVGALAALVSTSSGDLAGPYDAFADGLDDLEAGVQKLRDRATSLSVRRDEYLKHWLEQTSGIQNPELKAQAERRRTELAQEFMQLGGKGAAVKRAFAPLLASLRDCQRFLEADQTPAAARSLAPELERIRQMHAEVQLLAEEYQGALKELLKKMPNRSPEPGSK